MKSRRLRLALAALLLVGLGAWGPRALRASGLDGEALRARLRRPGLELRRVDFVGTRALEPEALWRAAGIAPGRALVDVDPEAVERALAAHPRVARARAARVPPGRLVIGITEREPVALDAVTNEGIDAEGARFALGAAEREGLPELRGNPAQALRVLAAARELGIALARVEAQAEAARVEPAGESVSLQLGSRPERDLASWLALRESGLLARHRAREIDLRFEGSAVLRQIETATEGGRTDGSQR
jgi:hypothetical protein